MHVLPYASVLFVYSFTYCVHTYFIFISQNSHLKVVLPAKWLPETSLSSYMPWLILQRIIIIGLVGHSDHISKHHPTVSELNETSVSKCIPTQGTATGTVRLHHLYIYQHYLYQVSIFCICLCLLNIFRFVSLSPSYYCQHFYT
eukprot:382979_1